MTKRYLAKIIAKDSQGLQLISACCAGSKVKINEIKYLPRNKIFLLSLERFSKETGKNSFRINRIYHLDRGYEQIEIKLKKIGARIKRVA